MNTTDWSVIGHTAFAELRPILEDKLNGDVSDQAKALWQHYEALHKAVDDTQAALAQTTDPIQRAYLVEDLEKTFPARGQFLVSAAAAYAGQSTADTLDAVLKVSIKILVLIAKAWLSA